MTDPEYCITAGTFARLCGTTREALRYYHAQGILVPRKDPDNGYSYYSAAQISSFYFIRAFRDLGCSVADIKDYLLAGEQARFDSFVDVQYAALLRQREELDRQIRVIAGTRDLLWKIREADAGRPGLQPHPPARRLKCSPVTSVPATSSGEIMPDILRHLERCAAPGVQAFPMGGVIGREDFLRGEYSYRRVFSFADESAEGEGILTLPDRRCAACVCRDSDGDIRETYAALRDFLRAEGLTACSDLYSLSMVNVIDPHETRRYLKYLFLCVED